MLEPQELSWKCDLCTECVEEITSVCESEGHSCREIKNTELIHNITV